MVRRVTKQLGWVVMLLCANANATESTQSISLAQGTGSQASEFASATWQGKWQWQADERWSTQLAWQAQHHSWTRQTAPRGLWQRQHSWAEVRQLAVRYQAGDWQYTAGWLTPDWRLTDTVSVASVWNARDLQTFDEPESLAQPAVRAIWRGQWRQVRMLEVLVSPQLRAQRQPSGIWQQAASDLDALDMPNTTAVGVRLAGRLEADQWSVWAFDGRQSAAELSATDLAAAALLSEQAQMLQSEQQSLALAWQFPRKTAFGATYQREFADGWISRSELGHIELPTHQWWQAVQGIEHEWVGEASSTLLLLQYSKIWQRGTPVLLTMDMDQQLAGFWLGRLQYDPSGDMRTQWQWEWSLGTHNGYWQARWQQRLGDSQQLAVQWRQLHGSPDTLWGRYRQLDGAELQWTYWF